MNLNELHKLQAKVSEDLDAKLLEMEAENPKQAEEMRQVLAMAKEGKISIEELPNLVKKWQ